MQAALSYEMRKANTEEDVERIRTQFGATAQAMGVSDESAAGMWIGAAFENQNQHLQFKYTNWQDGSMDQDQARKFSEEVYQKKGSYAMSQMHSQTIESLMDAGDDDTKARVAAVAETWMVRYGGAGGGVGGDDDAAVQAQLAAQQQAAAAAGAPGAPGAPAGVQPTVQTNTPGAAAVAEMVRKLAVHTGVYKPLDPATDVGQQGPPPTARQN
jgi:hypothetical protein